MVSNVFTTGAGSASAFLLVSEMPAALAFSAKALSCDRHDDNVKRTEITVATKTSGLFMNKLLAKIFEF